MKEPLVSVNMPVKNGARYIKEAIQSVLNQTFTDFELIIVNDASTDESADIVRSFSDRRIRLFENETNRGIAFTRNFAVQQSLGKYVAIFDCDDVMLPENLSKKVDFMENKPDFAFCGSSIETIDPNGNKIGQMIYKLPPKLLKTQLFFDNYFAQSSILIRRDILSEFRYSTDFVMVSDYFLWSQISQKHKVANLEEVLVKYRIHEQSITVSQLEKQKTYVKKVFQYQLSLLNIFPTDRELENHFLLLKKADAIDTNKKELLLDIKKWIFLIKKQNHKLQIFDNRYFNKCLFKRYRKVLKKKCWIQRFVEIFYYLCTL